MKQQFGFSHFIRFPFLLGLFSLGLGACNFKVAVTPDTPPLGEDPVTAGPSASDGGVTTPTTPPVTPPIVVNPLPPQTNVVSVPSIARPSSAAGEVVGLIFQNNKTTALPARYVTFGQPFLKGKVPATSGLLAVIGGVSFPVQMDIKTKYPDNTVKFAVLTVQHPVIPANSQTNVRLKTDALATGEINLLDLTGYSMRVGVAIQRRSNFQIDVKERMLSELSANRASYWLRGPLASQARVQVPLVGSMRLVFDVTKYADGSYVTDAQFNNDIAMSADGGRLDYTAQVTHGAVSQTFSLSHPQYMQWHRVYYSNGRPGVNIQHDPTYMIQSGAVLPYNVGAGVTKTILDGYATRLSTGDWTAPFAINNVAQYMPGTGGRPDIGSTTEFNGTWIATQSEIARDIALYQADTAAAVPWHYFDIANNVWLNTTHYPRLWTDGRGGQGVPRDSNSGGLVQQVEASPLGWSPDSAHQPDLSFVPYLMTGGRYYLDQVTAQASANIMGYWPSVDARLRGGIKTNLIYGNQLRGAAWGLRHVAQVANFGVDGSIETAYYKKVLKENLDYVISEIPAMQAEQGQVYGYLALGSYGGNPTRYGPNTPPWQQDFMIQALAMMALGGSTEAKTILRWMSNFRIGTFVNEASGFNPRNAITYLIGTTGVSGAPVYKTWSDLQQGTVAAGQDNGTGWANSQGYYGMLGASSLSLMYYVLGDPRAKTAHEWLMSVQAPFVPLPTEPMNEPNQVMMAPR